MYACGVVLIIRKGRQKQAGLNSTVQVKTTTKKKQTVRYKYNIENKNHTSKKLPFFENLIELRSHKEFINTSFQLTVEINSVVPSKLSYIITC